MSLFDILRFVCFHTEKGESSARRRLFQEGAADADADADAPFVRSLAHSLANPTPPPVRLLCTRVRHALRSLAPR
jgi:hypothetical protein